MNRVEKLKLEQVKDLAKATLEDQLEAILPPGAWKIFCHELFGSIGSASLEIEDMSQAAALGELLPTVPMVLVKDSCTSLRVANNDYPERSTVVPIVPFRWDADRPCIGHPTTVTLSWFTLTDLGIVEIKLDVTKVEKSGRIEITRSGKKETGPHVVQRWYHIPPGLRTIIDEPGDETLATTRQICWWASEDSPGRFTQYWNFEEGCLDVPTIADLVRNFTKGV